MDIDLKVNQFVQDLALIVNDISKEIPSLLANFSIKNGAFNALDLSTAELNAFNLELLNVINNSGYNALVGDYLGQSREYLADRVNSMQKQYPTLKPLMSGVKLSDLDNILLVNAEEFSLITQDISMAVQSKLTRMILGGDSLKNATEELSASLGSSLARYSETWLRTAYQRYIQQSEDFIAETVGFGKNKDDAWDYIGAPLQGNSHTECIWALQTREDSLFSPDQKKDFENGYAFAGQPSPPRYNCQHYFVMSSRSLKKLIDKL